MWETLGIAGGLRMTRPKKTVASDWAIWPARLGQMLARLAMPIRAETGIFPRVRPQAGGFAAVRRDASRSSLNGYTDGSIASQMRRCQQNRAGMGAAIRRCRRSSLAGPHHQGNVA
ncbi:hypothetical protein DBA20_24145 [Pandoraea capi]|nr:hypothetical protein [Pandoraea sp. LA3]MDN4586075.1 hypothetical protein [Pandoraea capi]